MRRSGMHGYLNNEQEHSKSFAPAQQPLQRLSYTNCSIHMARIVPHTMDQISKATAAECQCKLETVSLHGFLHSTLTLMQDAALLT